MAELRPYDRLVLGLLLNSLLIALISPSHLVQSRRLMFENDNPTYYVISGDTVLLVCSHPENVLISIKRDGTNLWDIIESQRTADTPVNFSFRGDNLTSILTIEDISEQYGTKYYCFHKHVQELTIHVMYKPFDPTPVCDSDYPTNQTVGHLSCTTEEAEPPVQTSMFIRDENGTTRNVTRYAELWNRTLSYRVNQSSVSNQSRFICEALQEFPSPYEDHTYTERCSLYVSVPSFLVTIEPVRPTVNHGENVTLTCASNISGITLKWSGVPGNCVEVSQVTIVCHGLIENTTFDVNCTGSYRGITFFNITSISVRALISEIKHSETKWYFKAGAVLITAMIPTCGVLGVLDFRLKRKRHMERNNSTTTEPLNVRERNSDDSPRHTEGKNQNEKVMDECYDLSETDMVENR